METKLSFLIEKQSRICNRTNFVIYRGSQIRDSLANLERITNPWHFRPLRHYAIMPLRLFTDNLADLEIGFNLAIIFLK
jgi:hypothetical protein